VELAGGEPRLGVDRRVLHLLEVAVRVGHGHAGPVAADRADGGVLLFVAAEEQVEDAAVEADEDEPRQDVATVTTFCKSGGLMRSLHGIPFGSVLVILASIMRRHCGN
jgi:hypothetical protein